MARRRMSVDEIEANRAICGEEGYQSGRHWFNSLDVEELRSLVRRRLIVPSRYDGRRRSRALIRYIVERITGVRHTTDSAWEHWRGMASSERCEIDSVAFVEGFLKTVQRGLFQRIRVDAQMFARNWLESASDEHKERLTVQIDLLRDDSGLLDFSRLRPHLEPTFILSIAERRDRHRSYEFFRDGDGKPHFALYSGLRHKLLVTSFVRAVTNTVSDQPHQTAPAREHRKIKIPEATAGSDRG